MYRAYKFRMYPNENTQSQINNIFGSTRFTYNYYLTKIKEDKFKSSKTIIDTKSIIKDVNTNLKNIYPFLKEIDNNLIIKTIYQLSDNYKKYSTNNFGYPKYRSKYQRNSFTITNTSIEVNLKTKKVKLPKLGDIKIRGYRNLNKIDGKIINATISKENTGKYYISIIYEQITPAKVIPKTIVGLDLGVKKQITMSNGKSYDNQKYEEKYKKKIAILQQILSKRKKGGKNYYKTIKKLNIVYAKLRNARKYNTHKITKEIIQNNDIIVCETLQVKKMLMAKKMSKQITDVTFYEIIRQLNYKATYYSKLFYQINTYYPSSQTCSICNHKDTKYKDLNEREYVCKSCNSVIDRDLNASINIMFEGLKLYIKDNFA